MMNKIDKVYDKLTVSDEMIEQTIKRAEAVTPARNISWKKVTAIAACVAVLAAAVAVPIAARSGAFGTLQKHDETVQQSSSASMSMAKRETLSAHWDDIAQYASSVNIAGEDMQTTHGGLSFTPEAAYYDGETAYISFNGSYSGDSNYQRFGYVPAEDDAPVFYVDDTPITAQDSSFYLLCQDGGLAGVLELYYPSDSTLLHIGMSIPRLQAMNAVGDVYMNEPIEGPFALTCEVYRTYMPQTYTAEGAGEAYVTAVSSTPAYLSVTYTVNTAAYPESDSDDIRSNIMSLPIADNGSSAEFVEGHDDSRSDGMLTKTERFTPVDCDTLTVVLYDKNDAYNDDGTIKEIARIEDIRLR